MRHRARILVVEDDGALRETMAEVLADEGHDVRTAAEGGRALALLDGWQADIVVLDLMMPGLDASAFRDQQRRRGTSVDAHLIVVSAARDVERTAERLGAAAWLAKPFRLSDFIDVIDRLA